VLKVFGDESHDSTKERIFAVAGLLGDENQWRSFRQKWNARLGGLVFHAADCESGYGDFRGMAADERHRLHRDLTRLLAESGLFGYGRAIDLAGCRAVAPSVVTAFPDMPYFECFLKAVVKLADYAAHCIPKDRVAFTFDRHRKTQYNAGLLYKWIAAHKPDVMDSIDFGDRSEPGIQAADLWARNS
jgi:hypothetical protein